MPSNPAQPEPHNPFYLLLLIASLFFVVTALAYAVMPMLDERAADAGADASESPMRQSIRRNGWKWLLVELGAMLVFGLGSMLLDRSRLRSLKNDAQQATIPSNPNNKSPSASSAEPDHVAEERDRNASEGDRGP